MLINELFLFYNPLMKVNYLIGKDEAHDTSSQLQNEDDCQTDAKLTEERTIRLELGEEVFRVESASALWLLHRSLKAEKGLKLHFFVLL